MSISMTRSTRTNFINLIHELSHSKLNQIPVGASNNIIWNYGHTLVTHQLLCYRLSGLPVYIQDEIVDKYKKGSLPTETVSQQEIDYLISQGLTLLDRCEEDYANQRFDAYQEYKTSYGLSLNHIDEALAFNAIHEGLHFGYAMSLRKFIK